MQRIRISNAVLWMLWSSYMMSTVPITAGFSLQPGLWGSPLRHHHRPTTTITTLKAGADDDTPKADKSTTTAAARSTDNKAMAFLRKIGKVGGTTTEEFLMATGSDEGLADKTDANGAKAMRKLKAAYQECTTGSGIIDDMTDTFPFTTSGTEWAGFTDRVMGGLSEGSISREVVEGRTANVLRGSVSLANNGGFVQMATNLAIDPVLGVVDASEYDGIELDLLYQEGDECVFPARPDDEEPDACDSGTETFNIHIKTADCQRPFSSYRATFSLPQGSWERVRLPWSQFNGKGPGADGVPFDVTALRRLGVVAIGKEMKVFIALAGIRFYNDE